MHPGSEDPLVRDARREAVGTLAIWSSTLTYTVIYGSSAAYLRDPESLTFILGFPDWVFWGFLVPWGISVLLTVAFSLFFMKDGDLGPVGKSPP